MPGCSRPPVISASTRNRCRLRDRRHGGPDLLEGHLAVQLGVERDEHLPQAAAGMGPDQTEAMVRVGGDIGGEQGCVRRSASAKSDRFGRLSDVWQAFHAAVFTPADPDPGQRRFNARAGEPRESVACGCPNFERGEAGFRSAAMHRHVLGGQRLEQGTTRRGQGPLVDQVVGNRATGRPGPGAERGNELVARDHRVLKREQSEEKIAVCVGGHGEAPVHRVTRASPTTGTEHGRSGNVAVEALSHGLPGRAAGRDLDAQLLSRSNATTLRVH